MALWKLEVGHVVVRCFRDGDSFVAQVRTPAGTDPAAERAADPLTLLQSMVSSVVVASALEAGRGYKESWEAAVAALEGLRVREASNTELDQLRDKVADEQRTLEIATQLSCAHLQGRAACDGAAFDVRDRGDLAGHFVDWAIALQNEVHGRYSK